MKYDASYKQQQLYKLISYFSNTQIPNNKKYIDDIENSQMQMFITLYSSARINECQIFCGSKWSSICLRKQQYMLTINRQNIFISRWINYFDSYLPTKKNAPSRICFVLICHSVLSYLFVMQEVLRRTSFVYSYFET